MYSRAGWLCWCAEHWSSTISATLTINTEKRAKYCLLTPLVSQTTASPRRTTPRHQRYIGRSSGGEAARCSDACVAREITYMVERCDITLSSLYVASLHPYSKMGAYLHTSHRVCSYLASQTDMKHVALDKTISFIPPPLSLFGGTCRIRPTLKLYR